MPTLLNLYLKTMIIWFGLVGELKDPSDELSAQLFIKTYLRADEKNFSRVLLSCTKEAKGTSHPLIVTALSQFYEIVLRSSYMPRGFVLFLFVLCDPQIKWKLSIFMISFSCLAQEGMRPRHQYIFNFTQLPSTPVKQSSRRVFMTCPKENYCLGSLTGD